MAQLAKEQNREERAEMEGGITQYGIEDIVRKGTLDNVRKGALTIALRYC